MQPETGLVATLCYQAATMDEELISWKREIEEARNKCYQLNYFTARQLLLLRSELAQLRSHPQQDLKPSVMHLLKSLSICVSQETVRACVCNSDAKEDKNVNSSVETTLHKTIKPIQEKNSIKDSNLTKEQHENYVILSDQYGYKGCVILHAIKELKTSDWTELEKWCHENETKFNKEDENQNNFNKEDDGYLSDSDSDGSTTEPEDYDLFAFNQRPAAGEYLL